MTGRFRAELTSSDAETRIEVVDYSPDGSIKVEGNPVRVDHANKGEEDNKCGVQPVNVLVQVFPGHRSIGNVNHGSGVLFISTTERNIVLGAVREGSILLGD